MLDDLNEEYRFVLIKMEMIGLIMNNRDFLYLILVLIKISIFLLLLCLIIKFIYFIIWKYMYI